MIVETLGWVAVADAVAGAVLALAIYFSGRRSGYPVSRPHAVGLAVLFGLPATLLFVIAWCAARLGSSG
jgi:hypothetical protein